VREDAVVNYSIVDTDVDIGKKATIGAEKSDDVEVTVIGSGIKIANSETVEAGKIISK